MAIRKRGNIFQVTNKEGTKVLGTHPTREAALAQLGAIEAAKSRRAKRLSKGTHHGS